MQAILVDTIGETIRTLRKQRGMTMQELTDKYPLQAALYCEIERLANGRPEGDWPDYYMVAVSKDSVPDKEVIDLRDPERYQKELDSIRGNMGRISAVKAGELEPIRCESCDYCRATKVLAGAVYYMDI